MSTAKTFFLFAFINMFLGRSIAQPYTTATLKPGPNSNQVDIYIKPNPTGSAVLNTINLVLAIPSSHSPAPSISVSTGDLNHLMSWDLAVTPYTLSTAGYTGYRYYTIIGTGDPGSTPNSFTAGTEVRVARVTFTGSSGPAQIYLVDLTHVVGANPQSVYYVQFTPGGQVSAIDPLTQPTFYSLSGISTGGTLGGNPLLGMVFQISLPLDLTGFSTKGSNCNATLGWSTANESNTSHFEIEQGFDGINYRYVKSEPAQGDGPGKSYSASVDQPVSKAWYRLKMVDRDGRFKYSPVRLLETSCTAAETMKIYPHPATAATPVFVELVSGLAKSVQIQIMNSSGTIVRTIPAQLVVGTNRIELNKQGLLAGTYIVRMISKETGTVQTTRFILL